MNVYSLNETFSITVSYSNGVIPGRKPWLSEEAEDKEGFGKKAYYTNPMFFPQDEIDKCLSCPFAKCNNCMKSSKTRAKRDEYA